MTAFYNEIDPYCAEWLRNLVKEGHIADGIVDERSIEDITPNDLRGFTQCHFFAGIGLWSLALRRAGVSDDTPLWTGSCPCQPFSAAGEGKGFADERHLWPAWNHLISQCRPVRIFGEQVASKDGLGWLDLVSADLEGQGYAVGAFDLCAAGFGAFHIRQRLYFTGVVGGCGGQPGPRRLEQPSDTAANRDREVNRTVDDGGNSHGLADADQQQRNGGGRTGSGGWPEPSDIGATLRLADADRGQRNGVAEVGGGHVIDGAQTGWDQGDGQPELGGGAVWHYCRDGKYRPIPVEPEFFPLANGHTNRVGKLRAYGNAIHVETATGFVRACM